MKKNHIQATIVENKKINEFYRKMHIKWESFPWNIKAGQFAMVIIPELLDPLLMRPFSIFDADNDGKGLSILYRIVGKGTTLLSNLKTGEKIEIRGPLGRGFDFVTIGNNPVLMAGGAGIAPMKLLISSFVDYYNDKFTPVLIYGAKSEEDLIKNDEFINLFNDTQLIFVTEDGSYGLKGLVTDVLYDVILESLDNNEKKTSICACGPEPMLKAIGNMSKEHSIHCQLSMEAHMACGLGLCLGCVVPAVKGGYYCVCEDGPVFNAEELAL